MISRVRNSIVSKMTLLVMGGTSVVFALVVAYSYTYSRKIILEEAEQNARNLTLSVTRRIEQEFRAVRKVPEGLAEYLRINPCDNNETLLRLIRNMVGDNPEVFGGAVAFEPGAFIPGLHAYCPYYYRTDTGLRYLQLATPTYDYFQKDYYHLVKLLRKPIWTEPYFDEGGGQILMVTYSVPLFWPDKEKKKERFRGIVTADVSLEWLTKLIGSIRVEETGFCFIISDTGVFVTYPMKKYIMAESMFSLAEELRKPRLREIGRAMIRSESGFEDIGSSLTKEGAFLAYARIRCTGWSLGAVFPKEELFAQIMMLHKRTVILAAVGIGLLLVVSVLVARSLARPLLRMAGATRQVAKGDLNVDLSDIQSTDEVGQLATSFGQMVEGLKQRDFIRDTFGRYLTKEVVTRLLESKDGLSLGGEAREITLMMSDLRGFTALTANMAPEQVISFLNRYLAKMVEILLDHRGVIDEIIGDGILAFFGAPEPLEDHPARAVACAVMMQAAMDEINALNEADGLAHLEMGVAVHTGRVVVGNIGSERRSKYGAVGSHVNFTGRMESYAVGGQVLISEETYRRVAQLVDVKDRISVQMKGVPGTVTLYDIKGVKEPYNVTLPVRDETTHPLPARITVRINRLQKKVVSEAGNEGYITHVSQTSIVLSLGFAIGQWEDIRMNLVSVGSEPADGEIYAKVVSVRRVGNEHEAVARLTSMSPQVYKIFQKAAAAS